MQVLSISEVTMVAGGAGIDFKQVLQDALTVGAAAGAAACLFALITPEGDQKLHGETLNISGKLAVTVFSVGMAGTQLKDKSTGYNFIQGMLS